MSLLENGVSIERRLIELSESGKTDVSFEYTPGEPGEKKMEVKLDVLPGEYSTFNNRKVFFINVLDNKIKVLCLAGAPSSDLSFIKKSLQLDENLSVESITQVSKDLFAEKNDQQQMIDSADVFFLIGFPSKETTSELLNRIKTRISKDHIPFFISVTQSTDINKLNELQNFLPFVIRNTSSRSTEVQLNVLTNQRNNSLISNNSADPVSAWNSLPPVIQVHSDIIPRPESEIVAFAKVNNVQSNSPMMLTRRVASNASIAVLASEIWKWKLLTGTKSLDLFDRFIQNSVKWLNTSSEFERVSIKTTKKLYSSGENVEFVAQVYDETLKPVSNAEVKINLRNKAIAESNTSAAQLTLNSLGSGLYEGSYQSLNSGDFEFTGTVIFDQVKLGEDKGTFNIGDVNIEMLNPSADANFLSLLSERTKGKYFRAGDQNGLFAELDKLKAISSKEKTDVSEFQLWSNEWMLILAVFLFALEWFLRKRAGML
ncbi:MAG: hypothetical protein IPM56_03665 [Ignavibacteriales bacterium]|nr:MAG: hypothetical protein IPM56_03665 [Ignavibacteriales bacterium]